MRTCRVCGSAVPLTAETHRGPQVMAGVYYLHFCCPHCTAGLAIVIGEEDEHHALIDDTAPLYSAARDTREPDEESDAA